MDTHRNQASKMPAGGTLLLEVWAACRSLEAS